MKIYRLTAPIPTKKAQLETQSTNVTFYWHGWQWINTRGNITVEVALLKLRLQSLQNTKQLERKLQQTHNSRCFTLNYALLSSSTSCCNECTLWSWCCFSAAELYQRALLAAHECWYPDSPVTPHCLDYSLRKFTTCFTEVSSVAPVTTHNYQKMYSGTILYENYRGSGPCHSRFSLWEGMNHRRQKESKSGRACEAPRTEAEVTKNNSICIQYVDKKRFKTRLKQSLAYRFFINYSI